MVNVAESSVENCAVSAPVTTAPGDPAALANIAQGMLPVGLATFFKRTATRLTDSAAAFWKLCAMWTMLSFNSRPAVPASNDSAIESRGMAFDAVDTGRRLAGGLYGVALGGAFFGESMFSTATDASKVCLAHLVDHLNERGFTLLDTQIISPHMRQFGVIEVPRDHFLKLLAQALRQNPPW